MSKRKLKESSNIYEKIATRSLELESENDKCTNKLEKIIFDWKNSILILKSIRIFFESIHNAFLQGYGSNVKEESGSGPLQLIVDYLNIPRLLQELEEEHPQDFLLQEKEYNNNWLMFLVLYGRLYYPLNELDDWQLQLVLMQDKDKEEEIFNSFLFSN